jgi:DNA-binding Lrp family transcriptional regulator
MVSKDRAEWCRPIEGEVLNLRHQSRRLHSQNEQKTMSIDDVDQRLIALLRNDARLPVAKLAAQAGVSRATATARIERLRRDGIIAGFTVVLQSNVDTGGVRAITMIEIDGKQEEAVTRRLMGLPEVRQLHTTNGRWDVVAEIEATSIAALDDLLRAIRQIDGIANTDTSILLKARKTVR